MGFHWFSCHKDWQVFVTSVEGKILDYSLLHRLGTLLGNFAESPFSTYFSAVRPATPGPSRPSSLGSLVVRNANAFF